MQKNRSNLKSCLLSPASLRAWVIWDLLLQKFMDEKNTILVFAKVQNISMMNILVFLCGKYVFRHHSVLGISLFFKFLSSSHESLAWRFRELTPKKYFYNDFLWQCLKGFNRKHDFFFEKNHVCEAEVTWKLLHFFEHIGSSKLGNVFQTIF